MKSCNHNTTNRPQPPIQLSSLKFSYTGTLQNCVLDIPDWQILPGEKVFLQGPSGCGKSTLLNLLSGLLVATTGEIHVLGQPLHRLNSRARDRLRAEKIGLIGQIFNLIPYLSIRDNLRLAGHFARHSAKNEAIENAMQDLQLDPSLINTRADQLSSGQQQRVAIARALLKQPDLVIADEPTSSLDQDARSAFMELLLKQCQKNNTTLLFVSHDASLARFFDHQIHLSDLNRITRRETSC